MDCDAFRDEMMDLLYGEAPPAVAQRLEAHEAACPGCREELASYRRLRRGLAAWRVPAELEARARPRAVARPYLAAAAALLLLVGGGLVLRGSEVRYEAGRYVCERAGVQASNVLSGMAAATGLAVLEDGDGVDAGEMVPVILL